MVTYFDGFFKDSTIFILLPAIVTYFLNGFNAVLSYENWLPSNNIYASLDPLVRRIDNPASIGYFLNNLQKAVKAADAVRVLSDQTRRGDFDEDQHSGSVRIV